MSGQIIISYGEKATVVQKNTALDLSTDFRRVSTSEIEVTSYSAGKASSVSREVILVGTPLTHTGIRELTGKGRNPSKGVKTKPYTRLPMEKMGRLSQTGSFQSFHPSANHGRSRKGIQLNP